MGVHMISPVIHFNGNCLDAIKLYERAFPLDNKEVYMYEEAAKDDSLKVNKAMFGKVMHSTITLSGTKFNMSDVEEDIIKGDMVCFNVFLKNPEEVLTAYKVLGETGTIVEEPGEIFFARLFTVVIDEYGIRWQIMFN